VVILCVCVLWGYRVCMVVLHVCTYGWYLFGAVVVLVCGEDNSGNGKT